MSSPIKDHLDMWDELETVYQSQEPKIKEPSFISSIKRKHQEKSSNEIPLNDKKSKYNSDQVDNIIKVLITNNLNKILVFGVGGAGSNAVNRLHLKGLKGAVSVAANTDAFHLYSTNSNKKLILGKNLTEGLGAGNDPVIGRAAAEESIPEIEELVSGADLVFVQAGMGGGTGTGAAPVIASVAKEQGALVVGVCTLPFEMEGEYKIKNALEGLRELYKSCDTVIVIPNEKLLQLSSDLPLDLAFKVADEILIKAVRGIVNLIKSKAYVNVDFADIRQILTRGGSSVIGVGEGEGEHRVEEAIAEALASNLLDIQISDAKAALIQITGGESLSLDEIKRSVRMITQEIGRGAEIIWGTDKDESLGNKLEVTVILSGVDSPYALDLGEEVGNTSSSWDQDAPSVNVKTLW